MKTPLFLLALAFLPLLPGQNLQAASRQAETLSSEIRMSQQPLHFKKQKKKWRLWERLEVLFSKKKSARPADGERKKAPFGVAALICFFAALPFGMVWGQFVGILWVASAVLAIMGLVSDGRKWPSVLALLLIALLLVAALASGIGAD